MHTKILVMIRHWPWISLEEEEGLTALFRYFVSLLGWPLKKKGWWIPLYYLNPNTILLSPSVSLSLSITFLFSGRRRWEIWAMPSGSRRTTQWKGGAGDGCCHDVWTFLELWCCYCTTKVLYAKLKLTITSYQYICTDQKHTRGVDRIFYSTRQTMLLCFFQFSSIPHAAVSLRQAYE